MTVLLFILVLSVLVLIHEAGHYFSAKKFGIKVEEFGFGFPPKAFGFKKGETIYSINWLPIGGFVKLYGEDEAGSGKIGGQKIITKDLHKAFFARPAWQRAVVIVAGVVMNFLLASFIFSYLAATVGVAVKSNEVSIASVSADSPAAKAGLSSGDIVQSAGGTSIKEASQLIKYASDHAGEKIILKVKSKNIEKNIEVTLRKVFPVGQGPMGISISGDFIKKYPWNEALVVGFGQAFAVAGMILSGLWMVVSELFTKGQLPAGVAGPVGIAQLTGQVAQNSGVNGILNLTAFISINLGVLNVLPIPALDGGRLFFILIELVTRRKVNPKYEGYAHAAGMVVLLTLIALITFHDISRLIAGQPLLSK